MLLHRYQALASEVRSLESICPIPLDLQKSGLLHTVESKREWPNSLGLLLQQVLNSLLGEHVPNLSLRLHERSGLAGVLHEQRVAPYVQESQQIRLEYQHEVRRGKTASSGEYRAQAHHVVRETPPMCMSPMSARRISAGPNARVHQSYQHQFVSTLLLDRRLSIPQTIEGAQDLHPQ